MSEEPNSNQIVPKKINKTCDISKNAVKTTPLQMLRRKHVALEKKVSSFKVGFDKWDVEIIDDFEIGSSNKRNRVESEQNIEIVAPCSPVVIDAPNPQLIEIDSCNYEFESDENRNPNPPIVIDVSSPSSVLPSIKPNKTPNKSSLLFNGQYFKIVSETDKIKQAKCITCGKIYSGTNNITSNFNTHLRKHNDVYQRYENERDALKATHSSKSKQNFPSRTFTQNIVDHASARLIIKKMLPISMVEDEEFRRFQLTLLGFSSVEEFPFDFLTRYKLKNLIRATHTKHQMNLTKLLNEAEHICLTTDIWGNKHRSFIGVTAHYLDPTTLQRKSVALACTRFPHPHTNERITEQLQLIYATYQIRSSKVVATVTDNASNFVKAFREFGPDHTNFEKYLVGTCGDDQILNVDQPSDEIMFFSDEIGSIELSNRVACASHTFELIGKLDITKAQSDKVYSKLYISAFSKLNRIWNKTQYSKSSELIRNILGSSLGRPVPTRWNAVPDSVEEILKKDFNNVIQLMEEFGIATFSTNDWDFMKEYVKVLKPITSALDNLQKTNCHFGILLPTIFTAERDLVMLDCGQEIKFCKPLARAALDGLNKRFAEYLDFKSKKAIPAIIATCTHPYFKIAWLGDKKTPENIELIKQILKNAVKDIDMSVNESILVEKKKQTEHSRNNVFIYDLEEDGESSSSLSKEVEVLKYLQTPRAMEIDNFEQLNQFRVVRKLFQEFNTALTSSAPVERLFSYAGMILNPKRQSTSDDLFEELLILNSNEFEFPEN